MRSNTLSESQLHQIANVVADRADRARNEALAVIAAFSVVTGALGYLGVSNIAKETVEEKVGQEVLDKLQAATTQASAMTDLTKGIVNKADTTFVALAKTQNDVANTLVEVRRSASREALATIAQTLAFAAGNEEKLVDERPIRAGDNQILHFENHPDGNFPMKPGVYVLEYALIAARKTTTGKRVPKLDLVAVVGRASHTIAIRPAAVDINVSLNGSHFFEIKQGEQLTIEARAIKERGESENDLELLQVTGGNVAISKLWANPGLRTTP